MVSCGYNTKDNSSSEMRCGFPQAAEAARRGARPPKPLHVPSFKVLCLLSTTGAAVRTNWKTPWATGCWEPSTCEVVSEAAGHGAEHAPCSAITRQRHPIQASVRAGCALTGPCPARDRWRHAPADPCAEGQRTGTEDSLHVKVVNQCHLNMGSCNQPSQHIMINSCKCCFNSNVVCSHQGSALGPWKAGAMLVDEFCWMKATG